MIKSLVNRNKKYTRTIAFVVVLIVCVAYLSAYSVLTFAPSSQLASVLSVSAQVPANQYNTLALQLAEKETELSDREERLVQRESASETNVTTTLRYSFLAIGLVLLLVVVNFYLDFRRNKSRQ